MTDHTPGPWRAETDRGFLRQRGRYEYRVFSDFGLLCRCACEGDARLMAAALEMHAALKLVQMARNDGLLRPFERFCALARSERYNDMMDAVEKACAKAGGRPVARWVR